MTRVDVDAACIAENVRVAGARWHGDPGRERMGIHPWCELEYAAVVEDSDRILADALTPAAWVLLARLGACTLEPDLPVQGIVLPPFSYQAPVMRPRATQRSPPQRKETRVPG